MKKIISALVAVIIAAVSVPSFSRAADVHSTGDLNVYNTVIEVPGIKGTYKFLQMSDTHVAVVPEDTSKTEYSHAVSRNAHFDSFTGADVNYLNMMDKMYAFAESEGVDAVLMTGDIIDFPSDENIDFLYNRINSGSLKTMYTLGNHDWTFPDASFGYGAYFSRTQYDAFQPRLADPCTVESCGNTGNCHGSYIDFGEVVVVMLDDSEDMFNYIESYTVLKNALALDKPTIVCYHSPLYSPTLTDDVVAMWKTNQIVGSHRGASMWTKKTDVIVSMLESSENIVGLFCGHVHFDHEDAVYDSGFDMSDVKPNNVTQYACPPGYDGSCRLITIKGCEETCEHEYEREVLYPVNCKIRGVDKLTCTKCGDVKKLIVDYTTHDYKSTVIVEPTCTMTGLRRYECIYCKDSYTENMEMTNHNYALVSTIVAPTVSSPGVGMYKCSDCGSSAYMPIPALTAEKGDVNLDGKITSADITKLRQALAGTAELDEAAELAADINSDGKLRIADLRLLISLVAGE